MADDRGLHISERAALKLQYAAEEMPSDEISGFGRTADRGDGIIELIDIIIPPQEVGGAHVDISPEVRDAFWDLVIRNGCVGADCERTHEPVKEGAPNTESLECDVAACGGHTTRRRVGKHDGECMTGRITDYRVWWHKHPGKGKPSPSSTDTDTLRDFASPAGFGFGWMIGVIISQDASEIYGWLSVGSGPWSIQQPDIDIYYNVREVPAYRKTVHEQVKKVTKKSYSSSSTSWKMGKVWDAAKKEWVDAKDGTNPPANSRSTNTRGGGAATQRNGNNGQNGVESKTPPAMVRDIVKSDIEGCVEITLATGATIVTQDRGQAEAWSRFVKAAEHGPPRFPDKRVRKKMNQGLNAARRQINLAFPTRAKHRRGEARGKALVNPDDVPQVADLYLGFTIDGDIVSKNSDVDLSQLIYDLNGQPVRNPVVQAPLSNWFSGDALPPTNEQWEELASRWETLNPQLDDDGTLLPDEIDLKIIEAGVKNGKTHIGFDKDGEPLFNGEEYALCFNSDGKALFEFGYDATGAEVIRDGTIGDIEEARQILDIREAFLLPADMDDADVKQFAEALGAV